MKLLLFLLFPICSISASAQDVNLKAQLLQRDSVLEIVFQKYLKANDSLAYIRNLTIVAQYIDSADRYTLLSGKYLGEQKMDSCIWAIHRSNMYINNAQVLLKLKKDWQSPVNY